jgi:hypothetical protein
MGRIHKRRMGGLVMKDFMKDLFSIDHVTYDNKAQRVAIRIVVPAIFVVSLGMITSLVQAL